MAEAPQDELKENAVAEENINDQAPTTDPRTNGHTKHKQVGSDPDAQMMVIGSLRSQIQDLFSQVTELNNKLVKSYDRVSDLEDDLHVASSNIRSSSLKISQLELERTQHLSALNTGLLVEKSHVTAELTRLMEKATEEAAQRGQAESARADIEKDLDDLSATLFGQANSMVAEARFAQHLSERKVEEAERALKGAEEAVGIMQQQMQALLVSKEQAERKVDEMQVVMGKGKWTAGRSSGSDITRPIRLMSSHVPYQEYLMFVAHLRSIHPSAQQPPSITALLTLPFLARLLNEDSEPTVRLDLAPSLNWLSRRSVLAAIHNGQLTIEPMSSSTLLQESNVPGLNSSSNNISCALCGTPIFTTPEINSRHHPQPGTYVNSNSISWPTTLFKKPTHAISRSSSSNYSRPPTPPRHISQTSSHSHPHQIHIFRLTAPAPNGSSAALPKAASSSPSASITPHHPDPTPSSNYGSPNPQSTPIYPLCTNNWCLLRLRATCSLWAFVRTGIVERIWEEEVPTLLPPSISPVSNGEKPPIPPRRRGLWGMASAIGEKAASWSEGDKDKAKKTQSPSAPPLPLTPVPEKHKDREKDLKKLPPPPPHHPIITAAHAPVNHPVPPPLPKRSEVRRQPSPTKLTQEMDNVVESSESRPTISEIGKTPTPAQSSTTSQPSLPTQPSLPPRSTFRPSTPANVPLPESRPQTPVTIPVVPGSTASAIPPPLPRRAAARVTRSRPVTPALNPEHAEQSAAASVTDRIIPESKAAETKQPKIEPPAVAPAEDQRDGEQRPTDHTLEAPPMLEDSTKSDKTTEATSVEDASPSVTEEDVFVDAEADLESRKSEEGKDARTVKDEAHDIMLAEKPGDNASMDEITSTDEAKTNVLDSGVKGMINDNTGGDSQTTEIEFEGEGGFVGNVTWEDRTWKELVRLKEDMFWARAGVLRP